MQQANSTASIADIVDSEMNKDDNSSLPIQNEKTTETVETKTPEVAPEVPVVTSEEESFTTFNPNDLTPELQNVYKKWQHDYTQTRQRERTEIAELKEKLTKFEQTGNENNQTHDEKVNDFNNAKASGDIDPNMSFQDYSRLLIETAKKEIRDESKVEQENDYIGKQEEEFMSLDPRFQEGPALDKVLLNHVASELVQLRESYENENGTIIGFDFIGEAKNLIEGYDSRISQLNKDFIVKQNEAVKNKTIQSSRSNPNSRNNTGTPNASMSFNDAIDKAFESN